MKLILITLALFASLLGQANQTNDDKVVPAVLRNFNADFKNAQDVAWTSGDNFYKAQFLLNGQHATAYYNRDGRFMAVTRNLTSLQLPIVLQSALKRDFSQHWISGLFEVSSEEGVSYFVTLENADQTLVLKSTGNQWETYQKSAK
ncbi:MAG TPA: hypothetical protein VHK69_16335 [Chitinophagaceae bacterium]|jgi:hypothetical protein|nr:hypothetical protein [Chitinophagaceae bacterium]